MCQVATPDPIRRTGVTEYRIGTAASVRLDVRRPDHLAPLLGFFRNEPAKVGGREREHSATEIGKPRLNLGFGKATADLLVELVDDLGGRSLWCADAEPNTPLVARHELT